ncbi:MAG: prolyl oligopeptidase family serine peptidase [Candidatus Obscuribacterales bacterium]|nr:prolyl oligopeptidase family serine peptidase [Candidatus Obscuribacterales bacterium]
MRIVFGLVLLIALSILPFNELLAAESNGKSAPSLEAAATEPQVDDYFGKKISDPYRWMEKGPSDPKFLSYLKSQNDYTRSQLALLEKPRAKLLARIKELDNAVAVVRGWQRVGRSVFYLQMDPGATTPSLMLRDEHAAVRKLLDPMQFDDNGTHASIDYFSPSRDARYVAVGVSLGGSENSTIKIIDVASGKLLPDQITRTQYAGINWLDDGKSFFYSRLQKLSKDAPASAIYENQKTYLHVIGRDADQDLAVFGADVCPGTTVPKAGFNAVGFVPKCPFVFASHSAGTTDASSIYIAPLDRLLKGKLEWRQIATGADGVANCESSALARGTTMYLLVDKNTSNRKVVSIDLNHPDLKNAKVVLPESDNVLLSIYAAADGLYVESRHGMDFSLRRAPDDDFTKLREIPLPYNASITGVDASTSLPGLLFRLESWTRSGQAFLYDPSANKTANANLVPMHSADFSGLESREVLVPTTGGDELPVSIICSKTLKKDASHPTILVGYGAYGVSLDPSFDPSSLAWLERGGIIAIAHLRGGGEFGERWHGAARRHTKVHTIDDVLTAARYLIDQKYTSPSHLAVKGTSAGGIAVGGAIVRSPELFAVAIDNVGMTDMLRFQSTQGGAANIPEFGDVTNRDDFKNLYDVSAYHHIVSGTKYPAVMGITGVNDPRVPSWMIAKMIAGLQCATVSGKPVLLRVDFDAGHGLGSSRTQREEQSVDEKTFILWQTGDSEFQP